MYLAEKNIQAILQLCLDTCPSDKPQYTTPAHTRSEQATTNHANPPTNHQIGMWKDIQVH